MNCEICGKELFKPKTVLIDGTQFDVCDSCTSLGKTIELPDEQVFERKNTVKKNFFSNKTFSSAGLEASDLVESFGKKIMQARQKKGLKLKDLAKKIFEKESVVQRIEAEKFKPSDKVIKKLEKELEIKLRE